MIRLRSLLPAHTMNVPVMPESVYDADVERAATALQLDLGMGRMDINTAMNQAKDAAEQAIQAKTQ